MGGGEDFMLVETLPKNSFGYAHLSGAVNLPPDRVKELAPDVVTDKSADIVVYCANDN